MKFRKGNIIDIENRRDRRAERFYHWTGGTLHLFICGGIVIGLVVWTAKMLGVL